MLHYAAPPIVGGVEVTIYHHARLGADAGYPVRVLAGRGAPFYAGVETVELPLIGSQHERVAAVNAELARGEVTDRFTALRDEIYAALRAHLSNVDVCIVHNILSLHKNLACTAALHRINQEGGTRLLAWCHDFAWQDALYTPDLHDGYPWNLLRTAWAGTQYVVVSQHRRENLAALLGIPQTEITVVTPGVAPEQFLRLEPLTQRLVAELDLLAAAPLVLLPARVTRRKNIEFAIEVMGALVPLMPNATLVVTGPPGPHNPTNAAYLARLQQLRQDLGVIDRVLFLYEQHDDAGQSLIVPDAVVADLYQLADVLLFPSRREGFGIPVLEAGLARLPVFASDIAPIRESGSEWVYRFDPDGDAAQVARAMIDCLARDHAYRLRKRVLGKFTWQSIWKQKLLPLIEGSKEMAGMETCPTVLATRHKER